MGTDAILALLAGTCSVQVLIIGSNGSGGGVGGTKADRTLGAGQTRIVP